MPAHGNCFLPALLIQRLPATVSLGLKVVKVLSAVAALLCVVKLCTSLFCVYTGCTGANLTSVSLMQTQIIHLEDAYGLLDDAVAAAMRNSKPVYISICCNLAGEAHPSFAGKSFYTFLCTELLLQHSRSPKSDTMALISWCGQ